jgi:hypothetical protein
MRKVTLGALVVVLVAIAGIVLLTAWKSNSDTPVEVAQQMVRGLEQYDEAGLRRVFCDPDLADLVLPTSPLGVRFTDLNYQRAPHPATSVTVTITGRIESPGGAASKAITWLLRLQKAGGAWCISGLTSST